MYGLMGAFKLYKKLKGHHTYFLSQNMIERAYLI
jgi:hypothetical protein